LKSRGQIESVARQLIVANIPAREKSGISITGYKNKNQLKTVLKSNIVDLKKLSAK
jgi:hypothetical protein